MMLPNIPIAGSVLALAALAAAQNITVTTLEIGSACACTLLAATFGDLLIFPNSSTYTAAATDFWDVRADLLPGCIFMPNTADQVAAAVSIFTSCGAQFAIRGGGHMNFPGSNNIDTGVLLALNNLSDITIANDNATFTAGPGATWVDVYSTLAPYGLYCIGGRLKTIGVPGLTLIGGFHYLINKYGFAMDNVLSYSVVLGNGTQVEANSTSNPNLFWALKGGANNFGIVTKFTFVALPIPLISTTIQLFNESAVPAFIEATVNMVENNPADIAAGSVVTVSYDQLTGGISPSLLGVQEGTESPPSRFANYSAIPSTFTYNAVEAPIDWHNRLDSPFQMFRIQFASKTMKPDSARLLAIYNDWRAALEDIVDVEGLLPTFVMNIMPASAIAVAQNNGVGNTWGLDGTQSLIIYQLSTAWANEADDLRITNWQQKLMDSWHMENQALDLASDFLYAGDSGEFQNVFTGFPFENVQRMREIRDLYDPQGVFSRLNWGGFKLGV